MCNITDNVVSSIHLIVFMLHQKLWPMELGPSNSRVTPVSQRLRGIKMGSVLILFNCKRCIQLLC
jgi:hypothetical protein